MNKTASVACTKYAYHFSSRIKHYLIMQIQSKSRNYSYSGTIIYTDHAIWSTTDGVQIRYHVVK